MMPGVPPPVPPAAMRAMRVRLADADDQAVERVLRLLDDAADASANEALLAPLRARLAAMRPARPLRFARLLFLPLDPLIVPAREWRAGDATVPRTAIGPMAALVQAALAPAARHGAAVAEGRTTADLDVIARAGAVLWPEAARVLATAPMPDGWDHTGLKPALFPVLARAVAAVLRRAQPMRELARALALKLAEPDRATLAPVLDGLEHESAEGAAMVIGLVLLRLPAAAPLLNRTAPELQAAGRARVHGALNQAVDQVLSGLEAPGGGIAEIRAVPLAQSAEDVHRLVALLEGLEGGAGGAMHRARARAIRGKLDHACQARFADGLQRDVLMPLAQAGAPMGGAEQRRLESAGRDLRRLEQAARCLGGGGTYDRLLGLAAEHVCERAPGMSLPQRARLVEILAGPDAAEALYRAQRPAA